jgi:hypothetical protein
LPTLPLGALAYVWWRHGSGAATVRSSAARRARFTEADVAR